MPELFSHEINRLDIEDQARFLKPKRIFTRADGELLDVDINDPWMKQQEVEMMDDKTKKMEMYLLDQTMDVYNLYIENMANEIIDSGFIGLRDYLYQL